MIKTVLSIEGINHTFIYRLHHNNTAVEISLFIHIRDNPVNERTKEIAFTKLYDTFRTYCLYCSLII